MSERISEWPRTPRIDFTDILLPIVPRSDKQGPTFPSFPVGEDSPKLLMQCSPSYSHSFSSFLLLKIEKLKDEGDRIKRGRVGIHFTMQKSKN